MAQETTARTDHHLRPTALGTRTWLGIIIIGLVGQIAWTVENLYLNVFVYDTITDNPTTIATMVAASAIAATRGGSSSSPATSSGVCPPCCSASSPLTPWPPSCPRQA